MKTELANYLNAEADKTKAAQFPTVQEQINYWNTKERLEHERVMNIRSESRDATNETRDDNRIYPISEKDYATFQRWVKDAASNPQEQASTTAKTLTQEEIEEREEATCEIYDEREREYTLLDDGRNPDGTGMSYAERNL